MPVIEEVHTDKAPTYNTLESFTDIHSQAIKHGDTVYVGGQVGADPETDKIVSDDIKTQTEQMFDNISAILEAVGTSLNNTIKVTIYLEDFAHYDGFNDVYREYFSDPYPARCAVNAELGMDALVEVELTAAC